MYREITPNKLIQKRGDRTHKDIADASEGKVTVQDLWGYELGKWKPSKNKLPHLLKALGATYDEISEPVELATV